MNKKNMLKYFKDLREKINKGKLIIFVGAGVSKNVEGMPYCVSKLIQSTSCGYRFLIYENTTIYVLFHSSPRTHMVLGIVFRLAIPD